MIVIELLTVVLVVLWNGAFVAGLGVAAWAVADEWKGAPW